MRLAFLGTGEFGVPALRELTRAGHEVLLAISQPDRPAGRGLTLHPTPIHAAADGLGIPHEQAADVNDGTLLPRLAECELGVVVAFGQKLGPPVLQAPRLGMVNIHGSLLPRYRGAAPIQWAVINGDATTGVTVFQINERWDAGAIWGQRQTPIGELETADELHDRLSALGAELIVDIVRQIVDGRARPAPQDAAAATRAPKLTRADGVVDWSQPAERVVRRIHGLWSWPTATALLRTAAGREERVQLARANVADSERAATSLSGIGALLPDLTVQCGRGAVRMLEVRPAGGKRMPFDSFARGRRLAAGDRWLPP
jgi:methionyl-tRNA formyltransferase